MAMRGAKHHSKTQKALMKTLKKCKEIKAVVPNPSGHGWIIQAYDGDTFGHHPCSKTLHKLRSWLRKKTTLDKGTIDRITKS